MNVPFNTLTTFMPIIGSVVQCISSLLAMMLLHVKLAAAACKTIIAAACKTIIAAACKTIIGAACKTE